MNYVQPLCSAYSKSKSLKDKYYSILIIFLWSVRYSFPKVNMSLKWKFPLSKLLIKASRIPFWTIRFLANMLGDFRRRFFVLNFESYITHILHPEVYSRVPNNRVVPIKRVAEKKILIKLFCFWTDFIVSHHFGIC